MCPHLYENEGTYMSKDSTYCNFSIHATDNRNFFLVITLPWNHGEEELQQLSHDPAELQHQLQWNHPVNTVRLSFYGGINNKLDVCSTTQL